MKVNRIQRNSSIFSRVFRRLAVHKKAVLFVFMLFLIMVLFVFVIPKQVKVKEIECKSQFGNCGGDIEEKVLQYKNKGIIEAKKSIQDELSNHPRVKSFNVQFKLPVIYEVNIIESKPTFAMTNEEEDKFAIVDSEGVVISHSESNTLPYLIIKGDIPEKGDRIKKKDLFALEIIDEVFYLQQVRSGKLEDGGLVIALDSGTNVIFPLDGDKDLLIGAFNLLTNQLNSIVNDSKMENSGVVNTIDLRFQNPVIR